MQTGEPKQGKEKRYEI